MKFKIKKGRHYHSSHWNRIAWMLSKDNTLVQNIVIPKEAWYPDDPNTKDDSDYNKLFGFGQFNHHKNSARFVWLPDFFREGYFDIFAYVYQNGKWKSKYITNVRAEETNAYWLEAYDGAGYMFTVNGKELMFPATNTPYRWILQPFHGGDLKAPQTYTIEIY